MYFIGKERAITYNSKIVAVFNNYLKKIVPDLELKYQML